ncbi:MAG TPA: potassium transporter TrkA [Bacteroidetes bacterium]|nr:potassium transporter TrkA [Bacteroidota bacterium]HRR08790.1 NAD-binding protein [Rhodothermales bacterium]
MPEITVKQRLRYWFDNTMSKGAWSLIAWLGVLSAVMILIASFVIVLGIRPEWATQEGMGWSHIIWQNLMRTIDAGTMGGDTGSWPAMFLMLFVTLGGIFIFSALIGVLNSGLESKLEDLRKGRSFVVENEHTIIYGWSSLIFPIITELVEANKNRKKPTIVILSDRDKVEMEDEIRARVPEVANTRIVCRSGSPIDFDDVRIVNPDAARSIIILAPHEAGDPDAHVIKTVLAILNNPERKKEPYHIVAELRQHHNRTILEMVGGGEIETVVFDDLVTRISVQTCRQTGLSSVLTDLLNFGGDEIYFSKAGQVAGCTFGDALQLFEKSSLIGLKQDGKVRLLPDMKTIIQPNDELVAISLDDDTIRKGGDPFIQSEMIRPVAPIEVTPEKTLILGWNERAEATMNELNAYVCEGSHTTVVHREPVPELPLLTKQVVQTVLADPTDRAVLDNIHPEVYDHILVLRDTRMGIQEADARTLVVLLHLRELAIRHGKNFAIVSEMGDVRNQRLADSTQVDDFIISDQLVSLVLAQVSENKALAAVFEDLFDADGAELYLKPASEYVETQKDLSFYTVVEAAKARNEIAIGWRRQADAEKRDRGFGIQLNPPKTTRLNLKPDDALIVLANH